MPIFKITQQQGSRVITSTLEAPNAQSVLTFLELVSTAKVKYIYRVEYESSSDNFPTDDFLYNKQFKVFAKNAGDFSKQVLIHNVKLNLSELEISNLIKTYLSVGEQQVKSVVCSLFMR